MVIKTASRKTGAAPEETPAKAGEESTICTEGYSLTRPPSPLSPFEAYKDGFNWPNLYEEMDQMLESCALVYLLSDLRALARNRRLTDPKTVIKLPIFAFEVMEEVESNINALKGTTLDSEGETKDETRLDALKTMQERHMMTASNAQQQEAKSIRAEAANRAHARLSQTKISVFEDELDEETLAPAYSVSINRQLRRVTLCFRGTTSRFDWATNYETWMKDVPNPMKNYPDQLATMKVHNVVHDYLFSPSSRGPNSPNREKQSEYHEMMRKYIRPILRKYSGYKLYVTGHGLGGALSTLFAVEAASEPDSTIPKPVTCVSIGSPYVGDGSFRSAHQLLERLGKLRHIRISNHKDLITTVPTMSFRLNVFDESAHVGTMFKHVGMNLKLYGGDYPCEVSYPKVRSGSFCGLLEEMDRGWENSFCMNMSWNVTDYWTWRLHHIGSYNLRIQRNRALLETLYLNDIYGNEKIVGELIAQF